VRDSQAITLVSNPYAARRLQSFLVTAPSTLFRPFSRLLKITVLGREFEVPENNPLLRCFQYLAPETVSYGRFCWNEDCQYCRINFDCGGGSPSRPALSCKLMVQEGMRVREVSTEIRYCLRTLNLGEPDRFQGQ
jgi:hypothetical protein